MTLSTLIAKNKNKSQIAAHIFGSGKSVVAANKLKIEGLKIAVGDMPWRAPNLGPYNYWVTNNTYFPIPWRAKDIKIIRKNGAVTLISTVCANLIENYKNPLLVQKKMKLLLESEDIILYDTHHFNGDTDSCAGKPCEILFKNFAPGKTIQEELGAKFNIKHPPYKMGHATTNAIALAILLNCNPIFIHGVELPSTTKAYRYYRNYRKFSTLGFKFRLIRLKEIIESNFRNLPSDFSGEALDQVLKDFQSVGNIAKSAGVPLYFTNKDSPLKNLTGYFLWK
jgi:hypothetical protein